MCKSMIFKPLLAREMGAKVFEILCLVEKIAKREWSSRVMTLLGFAFNSSTHILSIREPNQVELLHVISQILDTGISKRLGQ
jgi:hypothetical protein